MEESEGTTFALHTKHEIQRKQSREDGSVVAREWNFCCCLVGDVYIGLPTWCAIPGIIAAGPDTTDTERATTTIASRQPGAATATCVRATKRRRANAFDVTGSGCVFLRRCFCPRINTETESDRQSGQQIAEDCAARDCGVARVCRRSGT